MSVTKIKDAIKLQEVVQNFPWFIEKFIAHKKSRRSSPSTLLGYLRDFEFFFKWLMYEGLTAASNYKNIELADLNQLKRESIESYMIYLQDSHLHARNVLLEKPTRSAKKEYSQNTISRKISSLKSLFYYLSALSEDENGDSYLTRNVMAKIEMKSSEATPLARANAIRSKILIEDEIHKFVQFVDHDYQALCDTPKKLTYYNRNQERDVAIISLILSGGFRVSEIVNLDLPNIILEKNQVKIIRKGNKEDAPYFSDWGKYYLVRYLESRHKFKQLDSEEAVFLTISPNNPIGHRMDVRSIQKMIKKYAVAFGIPNLSVHKLRHSFATQFLRVNPDPHQLQAQLGHSKIDTTMQYAHVLEDSLSKSVNRTTQIE